MKGTVEKRKTHCSGAASDTKLRTKVGTQGEKSCIARITHGNPLISPS